MGGLKGFINVEGVIYGIEVGLSSGQIIRGPALDLLKKLFSCCRPAGNPGEGNKLENFSFLYPPFFP